MTRTMKNIQGEPTPIGNLGGFGRGGNTGVRRGVLCKSLEGEHSRQREEQSESLTVV